SNGKTTTKNLVVDVLARKFRVLGTKRSYNGTIGLPLTLLTAGPETEMIVVELGSNRPGEIAYLAEIARPDLGLITNLSETHLEYFKTMAGVVREKRALFEALPAKGIAFVNLDDPRVADLESPARRINYSLKHKADVRGRYRESVQGGELSIGKETGIQLPLGGLHLARNALAAAAVGLELGVPLQQIKEAIEGFRLPSGRGEIIQHDGVTLIDDSYNANLASTLAGLQALMRLPAKGRRIAVFGDMLELGRLSEEHHRQVGLYAVEQGVDEMFCYGTESRVTYCTARSAGMAVHHYTDKNELAHILGRSIAAGDLVYIKGSRGMAMETIIDTIFSE
ncbi:MAG: UDP-N-acetylmuramoyl-tripeptide--D-alanyl-D-alanine ligase, partial [Candidatus Neomarinimicrobiota bacterium]